MGGCHQQTSLPPQLLQNTDSQRGTLRRIGTGTELIDEGQRAVSGVLKDAADPFHMSRESGKALLNALLVTDVHEIFPEITDNAAFMGRDQKTMLCHGVEQTGRLDGYRFAAGVWACDDQGIVFLPQGNIHRYHLFFVDERMACPVQPEAHGIADRRHESILLNGQTGFCQQQIDLQHGLVAVGELWLQRAHLHRERRENPGDFFLFLGAQLHNPRVGFHHSGGLHEDRGAGGRNIVDDAAHLTAVLGANRHHIASIAQ